MRLMAMYWWIDRWRKSSAFMDMTLEEQGAYRNLLDEAHLRGGALPNDERFLAKACGDATAWKRVQTTVMARFELRPDGWHNDTLDVVLGESVRRATNQANYRDRLKNSNTSDNGRNNNDNNRPASPSPSPSPSLVSGTVTVKTEKTAPDGASLSPAAPAKAKVNGNPRTDPFTDLDVTERAGRFIERYQKLYVERRNGARYAAKPMRDYAAAVTLCQTWPDDERLDKLAVCFLTTDHKFAEEGSRTIPQFLALASWCDGKLAEWEKAKPKRSAL